MARVNIPSVVPTVAAASALTTLGTIPIFLVSSQSVLIRGDLEFAEARFGLAVSCFFGAAAVAALLGGGLVDLLGRRWSTVLAGAISAGGSSWLAWGVNSYAMLIFALVVLGVGNASLQLTSNISLAKSIPLHRQGLAFGVKQSAIPLAILLGGLAVPVISVVFGWRWTFIITGVFGVLVISYGFLLPRETPTKRSRSSRGERAPLKALLVAASAMAVASAAVNSFGAFIAAWGFQIGMTPSQTGYLMAAGSGASIAARVLTGHRADIRRGRNLPVVAGQMAVGGISLAFVSFDNVPMLWIAAILAFGVGWAWPGLMLFAAVRVGRDAPGAATGTIQAGAFLGGASGPALFGLLVAYSGYVIAWRASSLCMLLAAGLVLVSRRMFHRDRLERPPRTALGH